MNVHRLSLVPLPLAAGLLAGLFLLGPARVHAAVPDDPAERAAVVGQPKTLLVQPQTITLTGPRSRQQILVTGQYPDGSSRDLTPFCTIRSPEGLVVIHEDGFLQPKKNGSGILVIEAGGQTIRAPLTVKDQDKPQPVSFRHEVIASLNVGGCNSGACHGTPSGKNGFKLSLRGFDPTADFQQLTRDVLGRRTDRLSPEASLLLQKGLGRVPHEGGQRFQASSVPGADRPRLAGRGPAGRSPDAAGHQEDRRPARLAAAPAARPLAAARRAGPPRRRHASAT